MQHIRRCTQCGQLFLPDKFHPRQQFCSNSECREARRRRYKSDYNRSWREQNPDYFKQYWLQYREQE